MYLVDKQILFHEINETVFENSKQTKNNNQEIKETDKKKRIICVFGLVSRRHQVSFHNFQS